jgi:hypothetical protein
MHTGRLTRVIRLLKSLKFTFEVRIYAILVTIYFKLLKLLDIIKRLAKGRNRKVVSFIYLKISRMTSIVAMISFTIKSSYQILILITNMIYPVDQNRPGVVPDIREKYCKYCKYSDCFYCFCS